MRERLKRSEMLFRSLPILSIITNKGSIGATKLVHCFKSERHPVIPAKAGMQLSLLRPILSKRVPRTATTLFLLLAMLFFGSTSVSANPVQTPENAEARLSQGLAFLRSRDFQRAREEFKAAIKANPTLAQGHMYLGVVENQLGN